MNKATPVQMRTQLEIVNAFKKSGVLFIPIPALNHKDAENLTDMMVERVELLECGIPKEEQTCLTCKFEPEWEDDGINGISDYCQWIPQHKLPLSINYIKEQVFKNSPIKNCHAWRQK